MAPRLPLLRREGEQRRGERAREAEGGASGLADVDFRIVWLDS
jgi:hypothetical protein